MATVNTKIESLKVDGQSAIARFSSTNPQSKFEVKLDGWAKWRASGSTYEFSNLTPGARTLQVRSFSRKGVADPSPATREFVIEGAAPQPEPEPPNGDVDLPLLHTLDTKAKWDAEGAILIEAPGSSITDVTKDGRKAIRIFQGQAGERVETQLYDERIGDGVEALYTWGLWLPSSLRWPKTNDDNTVNQMHGNNQAGYTGGISIRHPSEKIAVRVKGGEELSKAGSHRYEYESDGKGDSPAVADGADEFGVFQRDRWNEIHYHVRWSSEWDGFVRCSLNGGPLCVIEDVPTFSKVADVMMTRTGFYPGGAINGPLEMFVADFKVYADV